MLAKAPIVNYEVYLINQGYVCAGTNTFEQAMKIAKNTGFECNIYSINSNTPHQPVATTSAVQEATSMDIVPKQTKRLTGAYNVLLYMYSQKQGELDDKDRFYKCRRRWY